MAVTLIRQPSDISFSRNPVVFEFQTDAVLSSPGREYKGRLNFPATASTYLNESFTLIIGTDEFLFGFRAVPDDSGLQLPAKNAGESHSDWLVRLRNAFLTNYYIDREYILTITGNSIQFDSRLITDKVNLGIKNNTVNVTLTALQVGINPVYNVSLKIYAELFVKYGNEFKKVVSAPMLPDLTTGRVTWDISLPLSSALLAEGSDKPNFNQPVLEIGSTSKAFYIKYTELYGTRQMAKKWVSSETKYAILGGVPKTMIAGTSVSSLLTTGNVIRFMNVASLGTGMIKFNQPVFLYWLNLLPDLANVNVRVKLFYSDNTELEYTFGSLPTVKRYDKLIIPSGVHQLQAHLQTADKDIVQYDVWLESAGQIRSEVYRYTIDYRPQPYSRFFVYQNSLGAFESLYVYGQKSNSFEISKSSARLITITDFSLADGEEVEFDLSLRDKEKVNTGFKPKKDIYAFRDFFLSREKYAYKNNRYYPIGLASNDIEEFRDGNKLFSLSFEVVSQYYEELFSGSDIEDEYSYAPNLQNYIPVPVADPENFDDRYYLKTQTYNREEINLRIAAIQAAIDNLINTTNTRLNDQDLAIEAKADINHTHQQYVEQGDLYDILSEYSLFMGEWIQPENEDQYYSFGVFVVYRGMIWKSLQDDNEQEPGAGEKWKKVFTGTGSAKVILNEDVIINWQTDIAPDQDGNPSGETYFQRFGNRTNWTAYYNVAGKEVAYTPAIGRTIENNNLTTLTIGDVSPGYIEFI
ncbi:hypothetical protein ACTFAO_07360 [Sphingobacterium spiritivorum]|uniref:hypothetical protein n=1 Tax=Sphingobacterium spiritivorum TaxID=258 RepID=UPI003F75851D